MKFGSLFAGIGGIDLGLERAGMECAWQVEIDDYCTRILAKHWPDVKRYGDVRECGGTNLQPVDLIAGGFPCQPHSVAGKRRGAEDDRNLWPEFRRIIAELRPRYVLAENVPGIITTYLDTVLSDLEGQGYTCATFNIPAVAFDAPHRRERIFVVAYNANGGRENQVGGMATRNSAHSKRIRRDVPDSSSDQLRNQPGRRSGESGPDPTELGDNGKTEPMADTYRARELQPEGNERTQRRWTSDGSMENTTSSRLERPTGTSIQGQEHGLASTSWWTTEPDVGRVAHGIPSRVDRLRGLGNAVVPQAAEWIGRRILEFDHLT